MPDPQVHKMSRWTFRSCLAWFLGGFAGLLLLLTVIVLGSFRSTQNLVRTELQRAVENGQPIDDASMSDWFRAQTHAEGSEAWRNVIDLADAGLKAFPKADELPIVGQAELPMHLQPGVAWPEEPLVAEFLELNRSLIEAIDQSSQYPTPIWLPIEFQGADTPLPELQSAREIARVLQLEFFHAVYHQDNERAKRAVKLLKTNADAFDWNTFVMTDILHDALEGIYLRVIAKSMEYSLWNKQELRSLIDETRLADDFVNSWKTVMAGERYTFLRHSNAGQLSPGSPKVPLQLMKLPQTQLKILEVVRAAQEVEGGELEGFLGKLHQFDQEIQNEMQSMPYHPGNIALSILMPACGAYADFKERTEDTRRFMRTGLAIKLYQLENGRWPSDLTQLKSVGAAVDDWTTLQSGVFGYVVEEDYAWLWTYSWQDRPPSIPATRPEADSEKSAGLVPSPQLLRIQP